MTRKDPIRAKSLRALATLVGRSPSAVRKWADREDWPFSKTGPWDVEQVRIWMIHLKRDPAASYHKQAKAAEAGAGEFRALGPQARVHMQKQIEQTLEIRARRLRDAGQLHDVEKCRQRRVRIFHAFKGVLLEWPSSLAHRLVGLDAEAIEALLTAEIRSVLHALAHLPSEGAS